jgi:peptidoglycan/LPS O-acetylase OafA/YrhL
MNVPPDKDASRDLLANRVATAGLFWLPIAALLASGFFDIGQGWRTAVWVAALSTMGIACLVNARRCGRVHCYATGPFFLLMALVALLYGLGQLPIGQNGWNFIGGVVLVGAVILCCVPEALLGRYRPPNRS